MSQHITLMKPSPLSHRCSNTFPRRRAFRGFPTRDVTFFCSFLLSFVFCFVVLLGSLKTTKTTTTMNTTKAGLETDEVCKLREQCALLEERLRLLERAVVCVLDSGEKVQVFRQCLQQSSTVSAPQPPPPPSLPPMWSKVDSVTSVATTAAAARAVGPSQG